MDPARAAALHAALGRPGPRPLDGDLLIPFGHQIYFWDPAPPEEQGRDGHTRLGGFVPDLGLPRRMWAGGQLRFHAPVHLGTPAEKRTMIEKIARKSGRTGPLALTTLRHEIWQAGRLCVTEHQDLIYRADPAPGTPAIAPPIARRDEQTCQTHRFNTPLLFRYSALTLNGHRIHYDETYARQTEGYDGLVVHGPLLVQLLMLMADTALGGLTSFTFRATSPLMHWEEAALCRAGNDLWVRGPDGRLVMKASAG